MSNAAPTVPLHVVCKGTPYEIGYEHGKAAAPRVRGSLDFYSSFFRETAGLDWTAVGAEAERWLPYLQKDWPEYVEEIQGLAAGAGTSFSDILALNVRTEVAFGLGRANLPSDGCTALSYHPFLKEPSSQTQHPDGAPASSFLAQNWDWEARQSPNLIRLTIHNPSPRAATVDLITEAGLIGKIGLSSAGLGVCLNAVRAPGVRHDFLPVHLALRAVLDADPRRFGASAGDAGAARNGEASGPDGLAARAAAMLQRVGVASAAHVLIADTAEGVGVETSARDAVVVKPVATEKGMLVVHTNHYVAPHAAGVDDRDRALKDSGPRLRRIERLVRDSEVRSEGVSYGVVDGWLRDEEGYPVSICRDTTGTSELQTLFSIVMDLRLKKATVRMGRPLPGAGTVVLDANAF